MKLNDTEKAIHLEQNKQLIKKMKAEMKTIEMVEKIIKGQSKESNALEKCDEYALEV